MDFAKFRPRGGTKAQWETANPVLGKREMGIQWESEIGVGKVVIKFGNGVTAWNNLDTAVEVENDLVNKIISSIVTVSDEYPILNDGDSLSTLVGKIKKYIQDLKDKKLDKSARYDGTDSTSTELVPTANALRGVNAKADKNASDITTLNNNLSKAKYTNDLFYDRNEPAFVSWNGDTLNTPLKAGLTDCQEGFAFCYGNWNSYMTVIAFAKNSNKMWIYSKLTQEWTEYVTKNDLLNLSRTFVSGDSFSDAKDLSIPPGIYGVNPGLKNIPENTYGLLEVTADTVNNWRFLKFTPTNIKSHYLMFYNGYDKTWSEWAHFASTT